MKFLLSVFIGISILSSETTESFMPQLILGQKFLSEEQRTQQKQQIEDLQNQSTSHFRRNLQAITFNDPFNRLTNSQQSPVSRNNLISGGDKQKQRDPFLSFYYTTFQAQRNSPLIRLRNIRRQIDGTFNNIQNPRYGAAGQILIRKSKAYYQDNISQPYYYHRSPRQISNYLGVVDRPIKFAKNGTISMILTFWGQFIDHDISLTQTNENQHMNINIPWCDQIMDPLCSGNQQMQFTRSKYDSRFRQRQQINQNTAWIDASQVYGSNFTIAARLRTYSQGRLITSSINLLPTTIQRGFRVFDAGDKRVNENVILTTFHTAFVREHNRVCQRAARIYSYLNDQQLYNIGKNYVYGLIQKITYQDFLPMLLGQKQFNKYIGKYTGYNSSINPGVANQFSTAGFRIGHSLLVDRYNLINKNKLLINSFQLKDLFFQPNLINDPFMENLIRGLRYQPAKQKDAMVVNSVRNALISGAHSRQQFMDLYALNIQRSKDHGLPSYNRVREAYGLRPISNFRQIVKDQDFATKLSIIYLSPDDCDVWVGIIAEDSLEGAILGQLGTVIVADQFKRIRDADRFWYQSVFPQQIVRQIKAITFEDILARNIGIQKEAKNIFQVL